MKKHKKFLSIIMALIIVVGIMPFGAFTSSAITVEQLNDSNVFLKQAGSDTCTLCAAAMMMRRYSMLRGDSGWSSITESAIKSKAWKNGEGLRWSFSYSNSSVGNISVGHYTLPGGSANEALIQAELKNCPEGIVIYNTSVPHAVLLTDYTDGVYYCADPLGSISKGRIPLTSSYKVRIDNVKAYWKVTSPIVNGPTKANTLTINYNANGGTIPDQIISYEYKVTEDIGINMRSDAGTGYSKVTALPKNTTFTVKYGDTKTADGYTWGKTTYNGNTGWVVISDFVEQTKVNRGSNYYLSSSMVYKTESGALINQKATYGVYDEYGFCDCARMGLVRDGYDFVGWSLFSTGEDAYSDQQGWYPEQLVPELKNGNQEITVYAVWQKKEPILIGVSIKTYPTKMTYQLGETLDVSGLTLELTFDNGTTKIVTSDFVTTNLDSSTVGEKIIAVGYGDFVTNFTVNVVEPVFSFDIKSVSYVVSGDDVIFTVTTTPNFNRVKVTKSDDLSSYLAYSSNYTVNADGDYVFTLSVPAIEGTTQYAFDGRQADTNKYERDYYYTTVKVEQEEETTAILNVTHSISGGKIIFTVITSAGDYNRVKLMDANNLKSYIAYAKSYTVNSDGNYVWTIKADAPTETASYIFDVRSSATNKYLRNYYNYDVEIISTVKSVSHVISNGKIVFTVITSSGRSFANSYYYL